MQPDQAIFLRQFLLPQLKSEQTVTKKIVSADPSGEGNFKPHDKCMTAFGLSWHIAVVEMWFLDAVLHRHLGKTAPRSAELQTCYASPNGMSRTSRSASRSCNRSPAKA
jgi:hypothetical protein